MIETKIKRDEETDTAKDFSINVLDFIVAQDQMAKVCQVKKNGLIKRCKLVTAQIEPFNKPRSEHWTFVYRKCLRLDRIYHVCG